MNVGSTILGLLLLAGLILLIIALVFMVRKGKTSSAIGAGGLLLLGLLLVGLLMPLGRRSRQATAYRFLNEADDQRILKAWSDTSREPMSNYPSFAAAVRGALHGAVNHARRCGVAGASILNTAAGGLPEAWLKRGDRYRIKKSLLRRSGSRLVFVSESETEIPPDCLEVRFDVQGEPTQGDLQVEVHARVGGERVTDNRALPFAFSVTYSSDLWVVDTNAARQATASFVIGRSTLFPTQGEARQAAILNARARFVDSALALVSETQPDMPPGAVTTRINEIQFFFDRHPELKREEFVQRTQADDEPRYRAAVLVDFPREDLATALDLAPGSKPQSPRWVGQVIAAAALSLLLVLSYLFLDAGTRGKYTWPLRFASMAVFAGLCVALWRMGPLF